MIHGTFKNLYKGLPVRCWRCWEKEGSLCFSEHPDLGGKIPVKDGFREGRPIDQEHFDACKRADAFVSKRQVWNRLLGDIPVTIISEENTKRLGLEDKP